MTTWMHRATMVAALAGSLAACAIQPNAAPRDIDPGQRPPLGPAVDEAGQATGSGRVFLVDNVIGGAPRLRSVPREAAAGEPIIEALMEGPNSGELDDGLTTALPAGITVNSARRSASTMTVDVTGELLELNTSELLLAVAQIVFTAAEIDGVRSVQIRVDGTAREVPNGRGELRSEPLSVYDFPGVAESVQPAYPPIPSGL
jgi:hypothetical protein